MPRRPRTSGEPPGPDRWPDFYIAGAPKCGTTALWTYLCAHPSVFASPLKEPGYFCADLPSSNRIGDTGRYLDLFRAAPRGAITGEASVWYLFSEVAIEQILRRNADARIVVMLRNPVHAVQSLHAQRLGTLRENVADFETAWRLQGERAAGRHLPFIRPAPRTLQYGAVYSYAPQIRRLMALVPPPQRLVMIFEEFFAQPRETYDRLLRFLGLPADGRTDFSVVNPTRAIRSRALALLAQPAYGGIERLADPLRRLLHRAGLRPRVLLKRLNEKIPARTVLTPAFERELHDYFAADIAALEQLLGRSLALWRQPG